MTQPKIDIHLHKVCAPPPPSHTARSPENTTHTPGRSSNAPQTTCTPFSYNVGRLLKRLRHQPSDTHYMTSVYIRCVHPRSTLPSTQASRKTDTKFQPLYASTSNKRCNLLICHDKAHKKTGHQKKTHPESDIHLHKVCAPPPPFPYTQIPRKHKTHTRPLIGCTPNNLYAFFM